MANKDFHWRVFKNDNEVRKILPINEKGGIVVIGEEPRLRIFGRSLTENDSDYTRNLVLAKAGAEMLNPDEEVKVIWTWILPFTGQNR